MERLLSWPKVTRLNRLAKLVRKRSHGTKAVRLVNLALLANLVPPLCSRHHHVVHELGWSIHLEPDRTLVIVQPDGNEFARTRPDIAEKTHGHRGRRRPAA